MTKITSICLSFLLMIQFQPVGYTATSPTLISEPAPTPVTEVSTISPTITPTTIYDPNAIESPLTPVESPTPIATLYEPVSPVRITTIYSTSLTSSRRPRRDRTPPEISSVAANSITSSEATINWITNEPSDTQIEYGLTTSYGSSTTLNTALVTNHQQTISDLSADTLYHYRVRSRDAAGNLAVSSDFTFGTLLPSDTTAPVISAIRVMKITSTAGTILWTTDEASTTQIEYGLTNSYGSSTTLNTSLVTNHSQTISGLNSDTLYHYRVLSRDAAGNLSTSADFTFTTLAPPPPADTTPPVISGVTTSNLSRTDVTINWNTNEASDTQIEYGLTVAYGNSTTLNSTLVTIHSQGISNLQANTFYHYRVLSRDVAGNLQTSEDFVFTTNANGLPVLTNITATPSDVDTTAAGIQEYAGTSVTYQTTATDPNSDPVNLSWSYSVNGGASINYGTGPSVSYNYSLADAGKTYVWSVTANDGFDIVTKSITINVINPPDTAAPIINNVVSTDVTESAATINWTTNEASNTQIEYGTTNAYGLTTTLNNSMVTNHSQTLSELAASTLYHYRVLSRDAAGNLRISEDLTFMTQTGTLPVQEMQITFDHANGHLFIIRQAELESQFGSFQVGSVTAQLTDANGNPIDAKMVFAGGDLYIVSECEGDVIGSGTLRLDSRSVSLSASMVNCELHSEMTMTPTMMDDQQSMDALFPADQVTHSAVQSGNFEDAATWGGTVPTASARILIENQVVVINSVLSQNYEWVFVGTNGALIFNPDVNTSLTTTTIGIGEGGSFFMGTTGHPVSSNVTARLQFTPRDAAMIAADIHDLGGGFLSAHGANVMIHGAETTANVNVTGTAIPQAGATQITLSQVPANWRVGGHIMLPATSDLIMEVNLANEEFVITAISQDRLTITLDHAIMKTPNIPSNFSLPIIYLDRNVQFASTDTSTRLNRAHMMFMSAANVEYASLMGMGRQDKLKPVTDNLPPTDPNSNQRARYALHFHRNGYEEEAVARGVVIRDTPGWQFVNHSSFVRFEDNVSIGAVGAAFVTEFGDEMGYFIRNVMTSVTGTGDAQNARSESDDYGHAGNGFWLQGTAVDILENAVWNARSAGIGVYAQALSGSDKGNPSTIAVANLGPMLDPSIFGDAQFISPTQFPMQIRGNTVVGALQDGIRTYYLGQGNENIRFVIEGNYIANVGQRGISTQYASNFDILNNVIDNSMLSKAAAAIGWTAGQDSNISGHITIEGNSFIRFAGGAYMPPNGVAYVRNNFFNSINGISILNSRSTRREINIENNIFGPNTITKISLSYQDDFSHPDRNMFDPDQILYTEAGQPTIQLFFREQAADFVPFHNTGTILDGFTNAQMLSLYGLAIGGALIPSGAVDGAAQKINAYIGQPVSYVRPLLYGTRTTDATYTPRFSSSDRSEIYWGSPVTLHPGINVIPTGVIDPLTGRPLTAIVEYVTSNVTSITLEIPTELSTAVVSALDTSIYISVKAVITREGGVTAAPNFNGTVPLIQLGNGTAVANFVIVDPVTGAEYWQSIIFTVSSLIDAHLYPDWWRL